MNFSLDPGVLQELRAELAVAEDISQQELAQTIAILEQPIAGELPEALFEESSVVLPEAAAEAEGQVQIGNLKLPEKIKLALFGNAVCRALLIRDSNKMVQHFVLKNPRIQPHEVEEYVKNPNLSEQVMRTISANGAWTKSYAIKLALVSNPKTPGDLALKWLRYLNVQDLRRLAKSKMVPQLVSVTARKRLADIDAGKER